MTGSLQTKSLIPVGIIGDTIGSKSEKTECMHLFAIPLYALFATPYFPR